MDEKYIEQAQALEMAARKEALYRSGKALQGGGQADCDDCGEPIPPARRLATPSVIRCIHCQTRFERP